MSTTFTGINSTHHANYAKALEQLKKSNGFFAVHYGNTLETSHQHGWKIKEIGTEHVTVEKNGKTLKIPHLQFTQMQHALVATAMEQHKLGFQTIQKQMPLAAYLTQIFMAHAKQQ